jgi:hypothetical protein
MTITQLPTAATSFYTVRKVRGGWGVLLVTPCPDKNRTTHLYTSPDRATAIQHGKATAEQVQRPFKYRGAI